MTTTTQATVPAPSTPTPPRRPLRLVRGYAVAAVSGIVLLGLVLYAVLVPLLSASDATRLDPVHRFAEPRLLGGPPANSLMGTDDVGRDLTITVAYGLRTTLLIAITVVLITACLGWLTGAVAAYVGGVVDDVLSRVMDTFNIFPGLLFAMAIVAATGGGVGIVILVLVLEGWVVYGRLGRAMVLSQKHADYVLAASLYGAGPVRILLSHLARVQYRSILSLALVQLPAVMLLESGLSFLGFGVQPPSFSLGLIVAQERSFLAVQPWPMLFAGGVLALTCVSLAMIGLTVRNPTNR